MKTSERSGERSITTRPIYGWHDANAEQCCERLSNCVVCGEDLNTFKSPSNWFCREACQHIWNTRDQDSNVVLGVD